MREFACPDSCEFAGKDWPAHLPKPTCRVITEYLATDNPVTLAVRRDIIRNRIGHAPNKCTEESK